MIRYDFDDVQSCLVDYFVDRNIEGVELERLKLAINDFSTQNWNGQIENVVQLFQNSQNSVPDYLLLPEFDVVAVKLYILWDLARTNQSICADSLAALRGLTRIDNNILQDWLTTYDSISFGLSYDDLVAGQCLSRITGVVDCKNKMAISPPTHNPRTFWSSNKYCQYLLPYQKSGARVVCRRRYGHFTEFSENRPHPKKL